MTTLQVLGRVYRAKLALLVVAVATVVAILSTATTGPGGLYSYVPTITPAVFASCVAAAASAAVLALPRAEALEVTAARPQWRARLAMAVGLYVVLLTAAVLVCLSAGTAWYFAPLTRDMVAVAGMTFALAALLPPRYVALAALAYVVVCIFGSRGWQWWDLLLAPPSWRNELAAAVLGVVGAAVYAVRGARPLAPEDEY